MRFMRGHYEAPEGSGGGAPAGKAGAAPGTADPAGSGPGKPGQDGDNGEGEGDGQDKKFSQADLDRILKERLEREKKKTEEAAEKAKREAELASLAQNQEWQTLAQKRQETVLELEGRVKELESARELADKYGKALEVYRDQLIGAIPQEVRALLEAMDVADQLTWLSENGAKFAPQNGQQRPGLPATPRAQDGVSLTEADRRRMAYKPRL